MQAVKEYGDVDVYTSNFRPLKATVSGLPDRAFMKLIVSAKTNKLLGLHMCGEDSPEIAQVSSGAILSLFIVCLCLMLYCYIWVGFPGICSGGESWPD